MDVDASSCASDDDDTFMICAAAVGFAMFMVDDDEIEMGKRRHKFWTRKWFLARNDDEQVNTMYKLQQELLQVGICLFK